MRIQVGDCVQLLTGGCLMTADQRFPGLLSGESDRQRTEIACVWFNDAGELKRGRFEESNLRVWVLKDSQ